MRYCRRCIQPDTRPGIVLDERGVCSACLGHEEKERSIDWKARERDLEALVETARREARERGAPYDCLVPVSGGKDSTYQVHVVKDRYELKPLCVTYRAPARTPLGQRNLDNLIRLGVDHFDVTVNPEVEKKMLLRALEREGQTGLPFHMAMFAGTLRLAVNYGIPLVVWGENAQLEYGGTADERQNRWLDRAWLSKHGCLSGTTAADWVGDGLTLRDLFLLDLPTDEELARARIRSIFLGAYLRWDPVENFEVARRLGFQKSDTGPLLGYYDFADLDDELMIIHHHVKWLKFGMTRTFDNLSVEIRNGRMTRARAFEIVRAAGEEKLPPATVRRFCELVGIDEERFFAILERFRNRTIWKQDAGGRWVLPGFLEDA